MWCRGGRKTRKITSGNAGSQEKPVVVGRQSCKTAQAVNVVMLRELKGQPLCSFTPNRRKESANYAVVAEALDGMPFYFPPSRQP